MFFVYMMRCDKKVYIGHTSDLKKRMTQHNLGRSKATKSKRLWRLVYVERYDTRSLAMKRESFLKTGDGKQVLKNKGIIFRGVAQPG